MTDVTINDQRVIELDGLPPFKIKVHCDGDMFISPSILRDGVWESCETKILTKLLQADTDFLDIGANIGWYTTLAAVALKSRGIVHAFEPDPSNFAILTKNVALNGISNAFFYNLGVSDHSSGAKLFVDTVNKGDHRLYDSGDGRESLDVETISIDEYRYINPLRRLIIKLDTQGSEVAILRGMKKLLTNHTQEIVLICEYWPFGLDRNGTSVGDLIGLVSDAGFQPFTIGVTTLAKTDWASLLARGKNDLAPEAQHHADFVAFRSGSQMLSLIEDMVD
jgi:FkbM family methyltransferase